VVRECIRSTNISNTKKVAAFDGRLILEKGRQFTVLSCASSVALLEKLKVQTGLLLRMLTYLKLAVTGLKIWERCLHNAKFRDCVLAVNAISATSVKDF